jgi:hypothetical protein
MSSLYVRQKVKEWLAVGTIPFVDTVNIEADPTEETWCTVQWLSGTNEIIDYCQNSVENGAFLIIYLGRAGVGDETLLGIAEQGVRDLLSKIDNTGKLQLMGAGIPENFVIKNHFGVQFMVDYEFAH